MLAITNLYRKLLLLTDFLMRPQNTLNFYTDDLSGHYVLSFVMRVSCRSVSNLQALNMGQDHLIVYLCEDVVTGIPTLQGRRLLLSERQLGEWSLGQGRGIW